MAKQRQMGLTWMDNLVGMDKLACIPLGLKRESGRCQERASWAGGGTAMIEMFKRHLDRLMETGSFRQAHGDDKI